MKTVLTFLAKVHIAHQAKRDSFPVSLFPLILLILPLILIKLMNPSVETELAHIIFVGRNTAVPLSVKPIRKKSSIQPLPADSVWLHTPQVFISSVSGSEITLDGL